MAEKPKGTAGLKRTFYKVSGERLERTRQNCPKCGPGVFMGEHANRVSCGKCGYIARGNEDPISHVLYNARNGAHSRR